MSGPHRLGREAYFTASFALLGAEGPEALTIAALCKRLKVTKGSFYHHFSGMPQFTEALLRHWEDEHAAILDEVAGLSDAVRRFEITAERVVNEYEPGELVRILRQYGEEKFAQRIVSAIVRERSKAPITSTARLAELVKEAIPAAARRTGGNPAKRTFQALRIEVNGELAALESALPAALDAYVERA